MTDHDEPRSLTPETRAEIEASLGQSLDEHPEILEALQAVIAATSQGDVDGVVDDHPLGIVEGVFQSILATEYGVLDPRVLASMPAPIRMLVATRAIEGQVDNGGWPAVFYNEAADLIDLAVEGYGLLGLVDHADLARRVQRHGWTEPGDDTPDDPAWEAFDDEWFGLPDAEESRTRYVRDHRQEFPA